MVTRRSGTPHLLSQTLPLDPIAEAALTCFAANGFHGTTIRQIARTAGLSVPGVYHHYTSKHAILETLCTVAMQELLRASRHAVADESTRLLERFDSLITCLIHFHAHFADIAFVTFSEIRSLEGDAKERHIQARREEQELVTGLIEQGCAEGVFRTTEPRHAARAITTICLGVSQWYRIGGPQTPDTLAEIYTQICRDAAGASSQERA